MQARQAQIDPRMAALMQLESANQALQTLLSSGVAPGTVAAQKVQQASAMAQPAMAPQTSPPPGIAALRPGVQIQAARSVQDAQPATQGDINEIRQRMAQAQPQQQPQSQGIADLPGADVKMAEGGVVGFAGDGEFGSVVPEVEALDALRVAEAKRAREEAERLKMLEFLEQAGSPLASKYKGPTVLAAPADKAPKKREPAARPTSAPAVQAAPPAPASTGMIDYAKALQAMMGAQEQGFKGLEELAKPQPKTQEELDFVKRQEEEVARRRAGLDSRRQQYLDMERMREEAGKATGLQDLAAFLTRAGGARTGLAGLGRATEVQTGIDAARRKESQAAIDRRLQYFDLLEQQRDAVEAMQTAISEGNMTRAAAERTRAEGLKRAIASLRVQTSTQMYGPTLQAGQSAADTQARITAQTRLAQERNAALVAAAKAKGMRPPPGMTVAELEKFRGMVDREFNPQRLGPAALAYLGSLPAREGGRSGQQLVQDIVNGNIKPGSSQWIKEVEPKLAIGKLEYAQELRKQTKYGAQPIPYSTAASLAGIAPADEED